MSAKCLIDIIVGMDNGNHRVLNLMKRSYTEGMLCFSMLQPLDCKPPSIHLQSTSLKVKEQIIFTYEHLHPNACPQWNIWRWHPEQPLPRVFEISLSWGHIHPDLGGPNIARGLFDFDITCFHWCYHYRMAVLYLDITHMKPPLKIRVWVWYFFPGSWGWWWRACLCSVFPR